MCSDRTDKGFQQYEGKYNEDQAQHTSEPFHLPAEIG